MSPAFAADFGIGSADSAFRGRSALNFSRHIGTHEQNRHRLIDVNLKSTPLQRGFTLLELLVVFAIIGILATVAIPVYHHYTRKAAMVEVLMAGHSCRLAVTDYIAATGQWPVDASTGGCSNMTSQYVSEVGINNGVILVTVRNIPETSGDYRLTVVDGWWSCTQSTLPKRYLPANCR